jgi:hypothetical protein
MKFFLIFINAIRNKTSLKDCDFLMFLRVMILASGTPSSSAAKRIALGRWRTATSQAL